MRTFYEPVINDSLGVAMLTQLRVCIKGAGEMASGIAWRLYQARIRRILMLEKPGPLAVRRRVSFCEAVHDGLQQVEGVAAVRVENGAGVDAAWEKGHIAVLVDPAWQILARRGWDVVIDATLAKRNLGTSMGEASLVIGVGPGFSAGQDVHLVIETNRSHQLGRVIEHGPAAGNTGIPGAVEGYTRKRVLRAPCAGVLDNHAAIGDRVLAGQPLATVAGREVCAQIDGVLRGLIRNHTKVTQGMKIGDIDPRGHRQHCDTISDKALAVAGGVLEALLGKYNA